ncbi:carboxypeptidase regulatory-like domain-containing protein [Tenacibaculum sp. S7007]|uniref:Carboxypeptidase regulatory-like domain-containing protein n=1 Tax=Tenacibaculum pelagium TaxID=2759527 RepID=A0A839AMN5_9FLAO|nr:carboxypeptidase regulatory-like domain-containing protein [Tenacibaculum pelagium]MBA6155630.1 carboxypeptidase regulatory-like domain-containing protein [Tenacibaculum pelagium]
MKNTIRIICLLFVISTFFQCGEDGTIGLVEYGDITGKVVEKDGFEPIKNVKITLSPSNNSVFTNADGEFKFEGIEAQEYSVQAEKEGFLDKFEAAKVSKEAAVNVILEMEISTALNKPPTKPNLLTPTDGASNLENKVTLTWEATDPDEDSLKYSIEIRNDFNNDIINVNDLTEASHELNNLKFGGKYFWQVKVSDGINQSVVSDLFSFTVKEDPENRFFYVKNINGNNVIYSSTYNFQQNSVENEIELTKGSNSWRPRKNNTSNLIAFLRTYNNEAHLYTMKPNGDEVKRVTSSIPVAGFNLNELDFSWSQNGDKLLYPNFSKLYSINKDGSGLQKIYETTDGSLISECDWSSDGTKIAIKINDADGYNGKIFTIDMSGNILHTVITGVQGALGGINFSASSNKLLYSRDISDFQSANYRQLNTNLFIYDFQSMSSTDISSAQKTNGTNDLDPRFSPNEAEVIFVNTSNDGVSQKNILKMNISGSIQRKELFQNATMPDWE